MSADPSLGRLRRILGLGFGLAVNVGSTIGIGILRAPGQVAAPLGTTGTILAVWLLGGLYTLIAASCMTELGAMLPQAGGYYVYARRAFGTRIGFAVGWVDCLTYSAVLGYVAIAMSDFAGTLVPALARASRLLAIGFLVGVVALQWAGVRITSWFQEWTAALKCLAFLALVIAALVLSGSAPPAAPGNAAPVTLHGVIAALQIVTITYAGWQSALYFTEEDRDPTRNLPRAMIGGVLAVIVIYLLVNIALLAILPMAELARATQPASDAAQRLAGARGGQVITLLSLISLPPLLNAILMIGTRVLYALGRDGLVWSATAKVTTGGTPGPAVLITCAIAIALIATGTFERLVALTATYLALNYAMSGLALIALRRREPALARPLRAWGYPASAVIFIAGAVAFLVGVAIADTGSVVIAFALLALGIVAQPVLAARRGATNAA